jgi:hypothetical protein
MAVCVANGGSFENPNTCLQERSPEATRELSWVEMPAGAFEDATKEALWQPPIRRSNKVDFATNRAKEPRNAF